jgi:hypothetical protein
LANNGEILIDYTIYIVILKLMDNTVGSLGNFVISKQDAYILGLWGADRYFRTSSIGISSINLNLIRASLKYFEKNFPTKRIKVRVYGDDIPNWLLDYDVSYCKGTKNIATAFHVYVNSRELVGKFFSALDKRYKLKREFISLYFAGRFDGDGSYDSSRQMLRIVYSNRREAEIDRKLLSKINILTSMYHYKKANTYCLYFKRETLAEFISAIQKISISGKL